MSEDWKADRQKVEDSVEESKIMPDLAETDYLEEREELTEERILEMLEERQYKDLKEELENNMYPIDLADILENFDQKHLVMVFRLLAKEEAAETFTYMNSDMRELLINALTDSELEEVMEEMYLDDTVDVLEEMPANVVKKILANASPETRRDINHLLRYPEDSAGSIMTVEYVDLKENLTVDEAIARIRKIGVDSETINICYVLDSRRKLVGTVALRYLLLSQPDEIIADIMHENVISINTLMDQEEVARQFQKYDFTAMPVVDNENRLVGIITVDDIVDILQEEATEDIEKMAAIVPSDKPYMKTGVFETFKKRIPWLPSSDGVSYIYRSLSFLLLKMR